MNDLLAGFFASKTLLAVVGAFVGSLRVSMRAKDKSASAKCGDLIAALFLSQLGTGPIQGFAVSLAIGVLSSVFTALFVSRLIFDFGTQTLHREKISIGWGLKK